jgi:hypothetical protein
MTVNMKVKLFQGEITIVYIDATPFRSIQDNWPVDNRVGVRGDSWNFVVIASAA